MTGGPGRSISHAGPFLNLPFPLGNGAAYSVPSVNTPQATPAPPNADNDTLSSIIAHLRGGTTKGDSPYAGNLTLSVGNVQSTDPTAEYLVIRVSSNLVGQLSISNWKLESPVTALGAVIGPANPLPISGTGKNEASVTVGAGATIYVISGRSPEGESFRKNLCTGYFGNNQSFTPSLTRDCPRPSDELKKAAQAGFIPTDACISYVNGLSSCQLVSVAFPQNIGSGCQSFITTSLTYNGCVDAHKTNADFYKNEWYLYLDRDQELWKSSNEQIRLLDENGKVVASVSY